jgi:hypothetical protein
MCLTFQAFNFTSGYARMHAHASVPGCVSGCMREPSCAVTSQIRRSKLACKIILAFYRPLPRQTLVRPLVRACEQRLKLFVQLRPKKAVAAGSVPLVLVLS